MEVRNNKTLLLTGITGFLGSHILKSLIEDNMYKIICLKRSFSNMRRIADLETRNVVFYNIDLIDLDSVFIKNKIEIVIHMATEYGRNNRSIYTVLETNLMFPIKIVETAIKYNVKCFINTDSYFNKEAFSYNYLLNYSLSKKSLLSWLKSLSKEIGIINVVLEHIYGEDDNEPKFTEFIIKNIAIEKKEAIDLTYGHQRRDFIYIADVVNAYKFIINYAIVNNIYFKTFEIGRGQATEIRMFIEKVKEISGSNTKLNYGKIPYRSDEIMESKANIQELLNMGWKPEFSIEQGIKKILEYYKKV
jgi:nucleoside-diphosphate-sugar epimerase